MLEYKIPATDKASIKAARQIRRDHPGSFIWDEPDGGILVVSELGDVVVIEEETDV